MADFFIQKQSIEQVIEVLDASRVFEAERGDRWKLFAVSLTSLASLERHWENFCYSTIESQLSGALAASSKVHNKNNQNLYEVCENALYLLARQKFVKFCPALQSLGELFGSFRDDLMMIAPAAVKYEEVKKACEAEKDKHFRWQEKVNTQGSPKVRGLPKRRGIEKRHLNE